MCKGISEKILKNVGLGGESESFARREVNIGNLD